MRIGKRIARTTRGFRSTNKLRRVVLNVILGFFLWSKLAFFELKLWVKDKKMQLEQEFIAQEKKSVAQYRNRSCV